MIILFTLLSFAWGDSPNTIESNPIVEALHEQLVLNQEKLILENAPAVYHLRYHYYEMKQFDAKATMGALLEENTDPYQYLGIEVRVGEASFDNTGFGGWENGFTGSWLPEGLTPHAAAMAAWRETDKAYKQAIEHYSRKKAQFQPPKDYPGDYTTVPPQVADLGAGESSNDDLLRTLAVDLSAILSGDASILRGEVHVGQENGTHWILDSMGSRVRLPVNESTIRAVIHVRSTDGMLLTDQKMWSTKSTRGLPSKEDMMTEIAEMRDQMLVLHTQNVLSDEYVGPVLFEDQAAIDLFRYLLIPQLEGTPPEIPFDSFIGNIGSNSNGHIRLGRRVLPPGWDVSDNPASQPNHPSTFTIDAEGSPSQNVHAVEDGILRLPMMSRVPRKDVRETNGHARGIERSRLSGRVSQLNIVAPKEMSASKLHKKAIKMAVAYGRKGYYAIRRLQEPSVRSLGSFPSYSAGEDGTVNLPIPVSVEWVKSDGTRTQIRGARLTGVQRWILRDIVGTGKRVEGTFMISASPGGGLYGPTQGLPTWMSAPEILVGEMEMVPAPGDPKSKPILPHPLKAGVSK